MSIYCFLQPSTNYGTIKKCRPLLNKNAIELHHRTHSYNILAHHILWYLCFIWINRTLFCCLGLFRNTLGLILPFGMGYTGYHTLSGGIRLCLNSDQLAWYPAIWTLGFCLKVLLVPGQFDLIALDWNMHGMLLSLWKQLAVS